MFQIKVNCGSPTLTETPRIISPPSPNRARPKPSPSPAPGLSLACPPPPLGFLARGSGAPASSGASSSWAKRGNRRQARCSTSGAAGIGSGVFSPPVNVSPSGTPLAEPASRESNVDRSVVPRREIPEGQDEQQDRVQRDRARPALMASGVHHSHSREARQATGIRRDREAAGVVRRPERCSRRYCAATRLVTGWPTSPHSVSASTVALQNAGATFGLRDPDSPLIEPYQLIETFSLPRPSQLESSNRDCGLDGGVYSKHKLYECSLKAATRRLNNWYVRRSGLYGSFKPKDRRG